MRLLKCDCLITHSMCSPRDFDDTILWKKRMGVWPERIMAVEAKNSIAFVRQHGIVLESAHGPR